MLAMILTIVPALVLKVRVEKGKMYSRGIAGSTLMRLQIRFSDSEDEACKVRRSLLEFFLPVIFTHQVRALTEASLLCFLCLLLASADDPQSDADDYSVQDESGTETTGDGDMTAESASGSLSTPVRDGDQLQQQQQHTIRITPPDTPVASRTSKAAHTATSKGLNVNVSLSTPSRGVNRFSKVTGAGGVVGLPSSPRPPHSPSRLDTFAPSLE